jgi:hypothetical protein
MKKGLFEREWGYINMFWWSFPGTFSLCDHGLQRWFDIPVHVGSFRFVRATAKDKKHAYKMHAALATEDLIVEDSNGNEHRVFIQPLTLELFPSKPTWIALEYETSGYCPSTWAWKGGA